MGTVFELYAETVGRTEALATAAAETLKWFLVRVDDPCELLRQWGTTAVHKDAAASVTRT